MIEVKLPRLPDAGAGIVFGPEKDAVGIELSIDAETILSVMSSVSADAAAKKLIVEDASENIKAANGLRPRPAIDPKVYLAIMSHVPEQARASFDYFTRAMQMIRLNILADSRERQSLEEQGLLKLIVE